eukprot:CAMPEP_0203797926 /NCGR_PEP_ID=MMETSP0100_2-20121128/8923_1 /ASSEMBLY_ACC=CAM_ASM_000210 /TAXON_ID=96639 /ORGANISM=" , Strain NY0313808BC1" /LENGTH=295 /DNA_ID=CAMNT_0050703333 /DNA_START=40 /DNA_END=927 /DNA_ORIENTATION=+
MTYSVPSKIFAVGDCIQFHTNDQSYYKQLAASGRNFSLALPKNLNQFPSHTFGVFRPQPASKCGGKNGLELLETSTASVKATRKPAIRCPPGQAPLLKVASTPENKCTSKYGSATSPWEQNGLLCYKMCKGGFYGVGPVCWARCPSGSTDGGVYCTKQTYDPHTRAIWPWQHCNSNEFKYGLECITKCKPGYKRYCDLVSYYCGTPCGPDFTDAGLTCTKHSYGRGAGKIAIPAGEFAAIVVGSIIGGVFAIALAAFVFVVAAPEVLIIDGLAFVAVPDLGAAPVVVSATVFGDL